MKKPSLEQRLLTYLKENEGQWFKKVSLYVLADEAGYSPETCGRLLRDLAESGRIKVAYYNGEFAKNLAKYSYKPVQQVKRPTIIIDDNGVAKAIL